MPQGGSRNRSELDRFAAAQRREIEAARKAEVAAEKAREKAAQQQHVEDQLRHAATRTATLSEQVAVLDHILVSVLDQPPLTFERLRVAAAAPAFDPGRLGLATRKPRWEEYAPEEPRGLDRMLGGSRYRRELTDAQARFKVDTEAADRAERQRLQALAAAKAQHAHKVAESEAKAVEYNARLGTCRAAFGTGDAEAVEWFIKQVLARSRYPKGFPRRYEVAYRPQNHDLVVDFELPAQAVVPAVREYRYVKGRDTIDPVPRPATEVKQRYAKLIASVALRTLYEIFAPTPGEIVEAVTFNGRVSAVDRATGKDVRPHLISVQAERADFAELVLTKVDPAACLKRLKAKVSPNPFDMEAVEPFIDFDLKRFRLVDDLDTLADLDSRPNLLKLSPTEFERLVRDLFEAMGAQAWRTVPSKDGGVDAVAVSKNLAFGGVCLIQAKRWTGLVGLDAVHALTGVMTDHNATTGVLVTTSWFSRTSAQFAQRNRITLINGAELKHLIKEHLGIDVIPGTNPPRRVRASDNRQTGRPGPPT